MWDGTQWDVLEDGLEGTVRSIVVADDGAYFGGWVSRPDDERIHNIAFWNDRQRQWQPLGRGIDGEVISMTLRGSRLYVVGRFLYATNPDGTQVFSPGITVWDGSTWTGIRGIPGDVRAMTCVGDTIFIGSWTQKGYGVYLFDINTEKFKLLGETTGKITCMVWHDGQLFVGGNFADFEGIETTSLVQCSIASHNWESIGVVGGTDGKNPSCPQVLAMEIADGNLVVAGCFTSVDGKQVDDIAMWKFDTHEWVPLPGQFDNILGMVYHESKLYVVGGFRHAGTIEALTVAWYGVDDHVWSTFEDSPCVTDEYLTGWMVRSIAVDSLQRIYVGGAFNYIGSN
jgi:hypothetical protein